MKNRSAQQLAFAALIAAVYAVLTIATGFMSYGSIQFRIAEVLCILPFFFPCATWGVFAGCLLANLMSPAGILDVVLGSLATLLTCICVSKIGKSRTQENWGACILTALAPVVINAVVVGFVLAVSGSKLGNSAAFVILYLTYAAEVALGEAAVMFILGLPLLRWLPKSKVYLFLCEKLDMLQEKE